MAIDKVVDSTQLDADLTSVANAIRTKGGTSEQLEFPDEFVAAIGNISGGGTPAIAIVDTPDSHGGVVREITALDISDSTLETADQLAQGITGYNKNGVKLTGTAAGGPIKRIAIRPDAELVQSWTYDQYIVADEGVAIPAWSTATQTLKTSARIAEVTVDFDNYCYFLAIRALAIPEYSTSNSDKGRFEWSSMVSGYEFMFTSMDDLHPLLPGEYSIATNSAIAQGGTSYRGLYFTSTTDLSVLTATSYGYGIWTAHVAPTYASGKIKLMSPNFIMRGQASILGQSFWEAISDIRFQYVFDLWRAPLGSMQFNGWQAQQSVDLSLDCLYSASHTLT